MILIGSLGSARAGMGTVRSRTMARTAMQAAATALSVTVSCIPG
jgi:hypothetical protein